MRAVDRRLICRVLLLSVLGQACAASQDEPSAADEVTWRVVDTTWGPSWDAKADSIATYRVVVEVSGATTTLEHVLEPWPVVTGDSGVAGLRLRFQPGDPAGARELFRLTLPANRFRTWSMPEDVWYFSRDVAISPSGEYIAYVAGDPGTHAVIRRLDRDSVLIRGPVTEPCECDVDRHRARWVSADSFEVAVWGATPLGGWLLMAGRAPPGRFTLDTLPEAPRWPRQPPRP